MENEFILIQSIRLNKRSLRFIHPIILACFILSNDFSINISRFTSLLLAKAFNLYYLIYLLDIAHISSIGLYSGLYGGVQQYRKPNSSILSATYRLLCTLRLSATNIIFWWRKWLLSSSRNILYFVTFTDFLKVIIRLIPASRDIAPTTAMAFVFC